MAENTEIKNNEEIKPQESKAPVNKAKKAPAKKKRARNFKKGAAPKAKKPAVFSDSLEERFPDLAAKLKKQLDDGLKQKLKEAQADPKVQAASKKFAGK